MHRFFVEKLQKSESLITLTNASEIHHLVDVLAVKKGGEVGLFDGKGSEAIGKISFIEKNKILIAVESFSSNAPQSATAVILACALPKRCKFETIIEKTTELGVDEIIPLQTARTEVLLTGERKTKKELRFHTVAVNAAKQCQRRWVPLIHPISDISTILSIPSPDHLFLVGSLRKPRLNIFEALEKNRNFRKVTVLIGPEGDFTPNEMAAMIKHNGVPVSLGEHTLKVDTAAITSIASIKNFLNWRQEAANS